MERVAIIVLNWNRMADTKRCLASLQKQTYKSYDIIVVDNGSTEDGTEQALLALARKKQVTVIRNTTNQGFSGGVNTAIRQVITNYDYIALFNNDAVADKKWLQELVKAAQNKNSAITTGLLLDAKGEVIDSTGDFCSTWGLPFPRGRDQPVNQAAPSGDVFSGSGGASLYSTAMLQTIGLFDEHFFAYYEDTDMGFRAQLQGYRAYYTDTAIAYHQRGATSNSVPGLAIQHTFKNLPLLFTKNMPGNLFFTIGIKFWLAYFLLLGNAVRTGHAKPAFHGYLQSVWLFWSHALPERWRIQNARITSVNAINRKLYPDLPPDQTGLRKFRQFFTGKI